MSLQLAMVRSQWTNSSPSKTRTTTASFLSLFFIFSGIFSLFLAPQQCLAYTCHKQTVSEAITTVEGEDVHIAGCTFNAVLTINKAKSVVVTGASNGDDDIEEPTPTTLHAGGSIIGMGAGGGGDTSVILDSIYVTRGSLAINGLDFSAVQTAAQLPSTWCGLRLSNIEFGPDAQMLRFLALTLGRSGASDDEDTISDSVCHFTLHNISLVAPHTQGIRMEHAKFLSGSVVNISSVRIETSRQEHIPFRIDRSHFYDCNVTISNCAFTSKSTTNLFSGVFAFSTTANPSKVSRTTYFREDVFLNARVSISDNVFRHGTTSLSAFTMTNQWNDASNIYLSTCSAWNSTFILERNEFAGLVTIMAEGDTIVVFDNDTLARTTSTIKVQRRHNTQRESEDHHRVLLPADVSLSDLRLGQRTRIGFYDQTSYTPAFAEQLSRNNQPLLCPGVVASTRMEDASGEGEVAFLTVSIKVHFKLLAHNFLQEDTLASISQQQINEDFGSGCLAGDGRSSLKITIWSSEADNGAQQSQQVEILNLALHSGSTMTVENFTGIQYLTVNGQLSNGSKLLLQNMISTPNGGEAKVSLTLKNDCMLQMRNYTVETLRLGWAGLPQLRLNSTMLVENSTISRYGVNIAMLDARDTSRVLFKGCRIISTQGTHHALTLRNTVFGDESRLVLESCYVRAIPKTSNAIQLLKTGTARITSTCVGERNGDAFIGNSRFKLLKSTIEASPLPIRGQSFEDTGNAIANTRTDVDGCRKITERAFFASGALLVIKESTIRSPMRIVTRNTSTIDMDLQGWENVMLQMVHDVEGSTDPIPEVVVPTTDNQQTRRVRFFALFLHHIQLVFQFTAEAAMVEQWPVATTTVEVKRQITLSHLGTLADGHVLAFVPFASATVKISKVLIVNGSGLIIQTGGIVTLNHLHIESNSRVSVRDKRSPHQGLTVINAKLRGSSSISVENATLSSVRFSDFDVSLGSSVSLEDIQTMQQNYFTRLVFERNSSLRLQRLEVLKLLDMQTVTFQHHSSLCLLSVSIPIFNWKASTGTKCVGHSSYYLDCVERVLTNGSSLIVSDNSTLGQLILYHVSGKSPRIYRSFTILGDAPTEKEVEIMPTSPSMFMISNNSIVEERLVAYVEGAIRLLFDSHVWSGCDHIEVQGWKQSTLESRRNTLVFLPPTFVARVLILSALRVVLGTQLFSVLRDRGEMLGRVAPSPAESFTTTTTIIAVDVPRRSNSRPKITLEGVGLELLKDQHLFIVDHDTQAHRPGQLSFKDVRIDVAFAEPGSGIHFCNSAFSSLSLQFSDYYSPNAVVRRDSAFSVRISNITTNALNLNGPNAVHQYQRNVFNVQVSNITVSSRITLNSIRADNQSFLLFNHIRVLGNGFAIHSCTFREGTQLHIVNRSSIHYRSSTGGAIDTVHSVFEGSGTMFNVNDSLLENDGPALKLLGQLIKTHTLSCLRAFVTEIFRDNASFVLSNSVVSTTAQSDTAAVTTLVNEGSGCPYREQRGYFAKNATFYISDVTFTNPRTSQNSILLYLDASATLLIGEGMNNEIGEVQLKTNVGSMGCVASSANVCKLKTDTPNGPTPAIVEVSPEETGARIERVLTEAQQTWLGSTSQRKSPIDYNVAMQIMANGTDAFNLAFNDELLLMIGTAKCHRVIEEDDEVKRTKTSSSSSSLSSLGDAQNSTTITASVSTALRRVTHSATPPQTTDDNPSTPISSVLSPAPPSVAPSLVPDDGGESPPPLPSPSQTHPHSSPPPAPTQTDAIVVNEETPSPPPARSVKVTSVMPGDGGEATTVTVTTAGASGAVVSTVGASGAGTVVSAINTARMLECAHSNVNEDDEHRPERFELVIQVPLGDGQYRWFVGSILVQTLLDVALLMTPALIHRHVQKRSEIAHMIQKVLSLAFVGYHAFVAPSSLGAIVTVLFFSKDDSLGIGLVAMCLVVLIAIQALLFLVVDRAVGLGIQTKLVEPNNSAKLTGKVKRKYEFVMARSDATTTTTTSSSDSSEEEEPINGEEVDELLPESQSDTTQTTSTTTTDASVHADAILVLFLPIFDACDDFNRRLHRHYFTIETTIASIIAMAAGSRPTSNCTEMSIGIAIVALMGVLYTIIIRPYRTQLDTFFSFLMNFLVLLLSVAIVVSLRNENPPWALDIVEGTVYFLTVLMFVQLVVQLSWSTYLHQRRKASSTREDDDEYEDDDEEETEEMSVKNNTLVVHLLDHKPKKQQKEELGKRHRRNNVVSSSAVQETEGHHNAPCQNPLVVGEEEEEDL